MLRSPANFFNQLVGFAMNSEIDLDGMPHRRSANWQYHMLLHIRGRAETVRTTPDDIAQRIRQDRVRVIAQKLPSCGMERDLTLGTLGYPAL